LSTAQAPLPGPAHEPAWIRAIDRLNDLFGWVAAVAVVASCVISAGNAFVRYLLNNSSNGWLEIQWYLFGACVMLGAAHVLRRNEHVRVDLIFGGLSPRGKAWVDLIGLVFFLVPVMLLMIYFSWPLFTSMFDSGERSSNAGGLVRWPAMLLLPMGFALLLLQGVAEIARRVAVLRGQAAAVVDYERPLQ
jgi:TRAP-type mannitol/chloroaromatic compound transport system permease small subunit